MVTREAGVPACAKSKAPLLPSDALALPFIGVLLIFTGAVISVAVHAHAPILTACSVYAVHPQLAIKLAMNIAWTQKLYLITGLLWYASPNSESSQHVSATGITHVLH